MGLRRRNRKSGSWSARVTGSILMYPRTARSTIVATMSLGCARSLTSTPASAGARSSGGAYSGLIERWVVGSRPYERHATNPSARARSGKPSGQLSWRNHVAERQAAGRPTAPGGQVTAIVRPSRGRSGRVVRKASTLSSRCST